MERAGHAGDDDDDDDDAELVFYPAFCFKASPTHFTWVKMAARDIHGLTTRKGYKGQGIFFYNNHPIRFVTVLGIIVARTEIPSRTILTIDDSSGAIVEVVVLKQHHHHHHHASSASNSASGSRTVTAAVAAAATDRGKEIDTHTLPTSATSTPLHISTTTRLPVDITSLTPGTLLKVKGTLTLFRNTMQLNLERFWAVGETTSSEMDFIDRRTRFLVDVLAVPWQLEEEDVKRLGAEADEEAEKVEREKRRVVERVERRARREEKIQKEIWREWEREERRRQREVEICRVAGRKMMEEIEETRKRRRRLGIRG